MQVEVERDRQHMQAAEQDRRRDGKFAARRRAEASARDDPNRSGHAPGRISRVTLVPTNSLELLEAAGAKAAVVSRRIEARQAHELLGSGGVIGKIVLMPNE